MPRKALLLNDSPMHREHVGWSSLSVCDREVDGSFS